MCIFLVLEQFSLHNQLTKCLNFVEEIRIAVEHVMEIFISWIAIDNVSFQHGVAIRSGHHCAQPLHRYLGVSASARASLYFYNTEEDVDNFIQALNDTVSFFNSFK